MQQVEVVNTQASFKSCDDFQYVSRLFFNLFGAYPSVIEPYQSMAALTAVAGTYYYGTIMPGYNQNVTIDLYTHSVEVVEYSTGVSSTPKILFGGVHGGAGAVIVFTGWRIVL